MAIYGDDKHNVNEEHVDVKPSFKVTLTFDGIDGKNPLEVAKLIAKWCKKDADTFTYDVVSEDENGQAWTVDLSEDDEDAVLSNNE